MLKFNSSNSVEQDFSLPLIPYLMINANSENVKKLHKTCKYFYAKIQINIVDELCMDNEELLTTEQPEPYEIHLHYHQLDKLPNNIWLTDHLLLGATINFSLFFPKIVRCDLNDLYLAVDNKFTINELKILTRSQRVEHITIDMVIYASHENDDKAPLEEVLLCLLSAYSIGFNNSCYVTENTMEKLMQLNFSQKLEDFRLYNINQMLDANLMDQFLQKNLEYKAGIQFVFEDIDENRCFNLQMFEKINAWTPAERKPRTFPDFFIFQ